MRRGGEGVGLVLTEVASLQFGAALAATLFPLLGPIGVVAGRLTGAALALGLVATALRIHAVRRPRAARRLKHGVRRLRAPKRPKAAWRLAVAFGVLTAAMNSCVYLALARLPLGAVITLEFLGPLGLALALSRRWRDAGWAGCALAGVLLLGGGLADADLVAVLLALVAAGCWAGYVLLSRQMGSQGGLQTLALAAVIAAVAMLPFALTWSGAALLRHPGAVGLGCLVGVVSSALPYALDLLALRRLSARVFGVLMSLNPAVATLAGWLVLGQQMSGWQLVAVGLVVLASVGATAAPAPVTPRAGRCFRVRPGRAAARKETPPRTPPQRPAPAA